MRLATLRTIAGLFFFLAQTAVGQSFLNQVEQRLQGSAAAPSGAADPRTTAAAATSSGYLGAELDDENEQGKGVRVTKVRPGAPAETSGLKASDLITTINGKAVKSVDDYDQLAKGPPGTKLQLTVERAGRPQLVTVTLGTRPAATDQHQADSASPAPSLAPATASPSTSPSASSSSSPPTAPPSATSPFATPPSLIPPTGASASTPPATTITPEPSFSLPRTRATPLDLPPPPAADAPGRSATLPSTSRLSTPAPSVGGGASLGITVETFNEQTRGNSGVPVRRGAVIMAVKPGSAAEQAGLPVGAVIVMIDGRRVDSSEDLVGVIKRARPGQEVELQYYDGDRPGRKTIRLAAAGEAAAPATGYPSAAAPGSGTFGSAGGAVSETQLPGTRAASPAEIAPRGTPPAGIPAAGGLGAGTNRPLLQRIERMADNLGRPSGLSTVYDPLVMAAMQSRIAELAEQVKALDDRLRAIESKLGVTAPAGTNPASAPATPGFGGGISPATTPGLAPAGGGAGIGP